MNRRRFIGLTAGLAASAPVPALANQDAGSQAVVTPVPLGAAIPPELLIYANDWPCAQGNLAATRNAAASSISAATIADLEIAWSFPIEAQTGYGGMTASPIVAGDTIYLQDMMSNVFALDRETGAERWRYRVGIQSVGPNGVALGYGLVFATAGDTAEVFAIDAASGAERWRVRLSNSPFEGIDMAPAVYDSTVYVSTVAGNSKGFNRGGTRGIFYALDADTGSNLWSFDTTTDNLWGNPRVNSGGGLWYPTTVDEQGNLYFGVANAGPWAGTEAFPNGTSRPGSNRYTSSVVSLDRVSGAVRWARKARVFDLFDHDFQNSPVLTKITLGSNEIPVTFGSGKSGTILALNQSTGEPIWEVSVGLHQNDDLAELPQGEGVMVAPGAWGGIAAPIAVAGSRLFAATVNFPTRYMSTGYDRESMFELGRARGELVCLDASNGTVSWTCELPTPPFAGVTTANDLVLTAGLNGVVYGVDQITGETVWSRAHGPGINAPLTIAGDLLLVAAATAKVAESEGNENRDVSESRYQVIALRLPRG
jgi:outer membrane protein assembly factor BamB